MEASKNAKDILTNGHPCPEFSFEYENIKQEIKEEKEYKYFSKEFEPNLKCDLCEEKFKEKEKLKRHVMSVHEGLKKIQM